jgi:23S rRNA pseudoU1915 N3-methylase RlmH
LGRISIRAIGKVKKWMMKTKYKDKRNKVKYYSKIKIAKIEQQVEIPLEIEIEKKINKYTYLMEKKTMTNIWKLMMTDTHFH